MTPSAPEPNSGGARDVLALIGLAGLSLALMMLLWEGVERGLSSSDLVHRVRFVREASIGVVTGIAVAWIAYRRLARRQHEMHTQSERQTEEARQARDAFEAVAESTPAGLWVLDRDHHVLFVNAAARRIHGRDIAIGERYPCEATRLGAEHVCPSCPARHTLLTSEPATKKGYRTEPATGEVVAVETCPIRAPGDYPYVLLIENLVTEQQKLQASLLHQEKMAALGLMAAGVAHDLGNPLAGIDMHLQLLQEEPLPDDARESVVTVRREVARLQRTLRDLIDFARRRRSEATLVSVDDVVEDVLRLLRHDQRMHGVDMQVQADPQTPPVYMVEDHLMQVVLNLMINSLDSMPQGGRLRVEIQPSDHGVALRVRDTGTGMSRDVLDRACEPLFSTKPEGRGTGLGLSVCTDILRAVGGDLELHSAPQQGTTAVVTLPAAPAEPIDVTSPPASAEDGPAARSRVA